MTSPVLQENPARRRMVLAGRIEPDDPPVLLDHLQAAADVHGGGRDHAALLDQRELGRAAADVDVEDALVRIVRHARGARAVGREHRLHVVAGGGADEIAALRATGRRRSPAAFSRRSASPVRITTPVSMSAGASPAAA